MKLWLLRPKDGLDDDENPWEPEWEKRFGFVIRAETEAEAREIASVHARSEVDDFVDAWRNSRYSNCVELTENGNTEVVIYDEHD